jgi:hypothetical protein
VLEGFLRDSHGRADTFADERVLSATARSL